MKLKSILVGVLLFPGLAAYSVQAGKVEDQIRKSLAKNLPNYKFTNLKPSPVKGLYQFEVGARILYVDKTGNYIVAGNVFDMKTETNLTEKSRGKIVLRMISSLPESEMIVIGPKKRKRTMTVFTDVDCPYCYRLHLEVPELVKNGVAVRYLLYPRGGINSNTYKRSVAVWCAEDRVKAIGKAKAKKAIDMKSCPNPVEKHYRLGQAVGVTGTPTLIYDDGTIVGGYLTAKKILAALGEK